MISEIGGGGLVQGNGPLKEGPHSYSCGLKVCLSFHVVPCRSMSFHVVPCRSMSFHVVPCRSMSFLNAPEAQRCLRFLSNSTLGCEETDVMPWCSEKQKLAEDLQKTGRKST